MRLAVLVDSKKGILQNVLGGRWFASDRQCCPVYTRLVTLVQSAQRIQVSGLQLDD